MLPNDLRPLGLGELLDRAVTLFVRHFGVLVTTLAVTYVPFLFVQWALVGGLVMRKPATLARGEWLSLGLDVVAGILVFALARTAVAQAAYAVYMSQTPSLRTAYRVAVQRFDAQIVTFIFGSLVGAAMLLAVTIVLIVIAAIAALGGSSGAIPVLIAMGIAGLVTAVLSAWLFLGFELATVRIAIGTPRPYTALFQALRATMFRRPWPSLLAAVTLMAVALGGSLISSALLELIPSAAVRTFVTFAVSSVESIVFEALTVAFLVAYAVDLMVRREGLDLAVALDAAPRQ